MKQDVPKKTICMIVPNPKVKGGIAAVTGGYYGSRMEDEFRVLYIQSYCDGSKLRKLFKALGAYLSFFWTIHTKHIDLLHIHSSFGPSFYRKKIFIDMAARKHIPIVNHIHGADFESFYLNAGREKKSVIEKCYGKCSRLIALSDEWKEKLSQIVDESRITVIPNYSVIHADAVEERCTDIRENNDLTGPLESVKSEEAQRLANMFAPGNSEAQLPASGKAVNILFLGELGTRKGVFDIPDIACLLLDMCQRNTRCSHPAIDSQEEKCSHPAMGCQGERSSQPAIRDEGIRAIPHFILAGAGNEEDERAIRAQIKDLDLQDMFSFPGWIRGDDKDKMLRKADIFFLPSYNEGMPMSILDACGYGLPVVSTNVGGIPRIVGNGYNGFLYNPGDKEGIAAGLFELCADKKLRCLYGKHSLDLVTRDYSLESHLEKLEQIWSDVCLKK